MKRTLHLVIMAVIASIFFLFIASAEPVALSKESVQAVLDSIDNALLKKDATAVIANYASNAVITATVVGHGREDKTHYDTNKS